MLTTGTARLGAEAACLCPRKHLEEEGVITNAILESTVGLSDTFSLRSSKWLSRSS